MKRIQTVEANPANAVLILVNLQNEFCQPGGLVFDEINPQAMPGVLVAAARLLGKAALPASPSSTSNRCAAPTTRSLPAMASSPFSARARGTARSPMR